MLKTLDTLEHWNNKIAEQLEVPTYRGKAHVGAVLNEVVFYVCITTVILFALSKL
jgi:hypothetical protein